MKSLTKLFVLFLAIATSSCGDKFLDIRRNANQVVPQTIADYQAILDVNTVMNNVPAHTLGVVGSDEYYIDDGMLESVGQPWQRNAYVWAADVYEGEEAIDWNRAYQRILYANMALDVRKTNPEAAEAGAWNNVVGSALFFRALNHYQLAQLFMQPYDPLTANKKRALPLKLDYDISITGTIPNTEVYYAQIVSDAREAMSLLPDRSENTFRPSKAAACALLVRCYLQMQRYDEAIDVANVGLDISGLLLDYNTLHLDEAYTFPMDNGMSNPDVLFYSMLAGQAIMTEERFNVDSILYKSYDDNDLRKRAYFRQSPDLRIMYKGAYTGYPSSSPFAGLTASEMLISRAECHARVGNTEKALADLNELLRNRFERTEFEPVSLSDPDELLYAILLERRKELYLRCLRWEDLRRLNKDPRFATTLVREIDGRRYELLPLDSKWTWPIPDNEVALTGIEQNPR